MELTLALPRQRGTAPILAVAILLGLLLSPLLERALEAWMPGSVAGASPAAKGDPGQGASWDMRSMWN